jgi:uncharacterized membrane protein YjjP (DUF1212 family)
MIGNAGVSAGVSLLFTTSWRIILATFLTGLIVDPLLAAVEHWRVPPFFQQFAGAAVITLIAAGITEATARGPASLSASTQRSSSSWVALSCSWRV